MERVPTSQAENPASSGTNEIGEPLAKERVVSLEEALKLDPRSTWKLLPSNRRSVSHPPQLEVKPEEDARLPLLEAEIETRWRKYRRDYVKDLTKRGELKNQIRRTALCCMEVLNDCEKRGLNPDQGRELIQPLIDPELETY